MSQDFDYSKFTPLDNTLQQYNIFRSAYKNIRFALPVNETITVKEHDIGNLAGLAFKSYGDVSMWRVIQEYNGIQDPIQDMWAGQILKLPLKSAVIQYMNDQLHSKSQTFII